MNRRDGLAIVCLLAIIPLIYVPYFHPFVRYAIEGEVVGKDVDPYPSGWGHYVLIKHTNGTQAITNLGIERWESIEVGDRFRVTFYRNMLYHATGHYMEELRTP